METRTLQGRDKRFHPFAQLDNRVNDRMKAMESSTIPYRSGFVAVMGKPNVGKSTLVNALLGQKIAAVSPRPQTTRRRQLGILTLDNAQIIFVDTPGMLKPRHKLDESMVKTASETLADCDAILMLVDASQPPEEADTLLAAQVSKLASRTPVLLLLNMIDKADPHVLAQHTQAFQELVPEAVPVAISATRGDGLDYLLRTLIERLPESPALYPEGQVTDLYEREIAADLIREAALNLLYDEVPHGIAVRIDQYLERGEHGAYIEATIFVERESHKGIVIGQGGSMLKQIGSKARQQIEEMSNRKVFLELKVKVSKNWRNDAKSLRWFGY
jgi:GTPase